MLSARSYELKVDRYALVQQLVVVRAAQPEAFCRIQIGDGSMGPITSALHKAFFDIVNGTVPDRFNWLTPVNVKVAEPVGV